MKKIIFILCTILLLFFNIVNIMAQRSKGHDRSYLLSKDMISYVDIASRRIYVTDKAVTKLKRINFKKYSYLRIENVDYKFFILNMYMSVAPTQFFVLRDESSLLFDSPNSIYFVATQKNVDSHFNSDIDTVFQNYIK